MHCVGVKFLTQKYATLTNIIITTATAARVSKIQQKSSIFVKKSDFLVQVQVQVQLGCWLHQTEVAVISLMRRCVLRLFVKTLLIGRDFRPDQSDVLCHTAFGKTKTWQQMSSKLLFITFLCLI